MFIRALQRECLNMVISGAHRMLLRGVKKWRAGIRYLGSL